MKLYRITDATPAQNLPPRHNIAPTQDVPVVRPAEGGDHKLTMMRWGLIPFWAKDLKIGYSTINAKAETVAEKPSFREAYKKRRCLIPADGFFEGILPQTSAAASSGADILNQLREGPCV